MTDYKELAQLLFPNITKAPQDMEDMYPPRALKDGARVTRFAPSPTGFLHFGNLFTCLWKNCVDSVFKKSLYIPLVAASSDSWNCESL